VTKIIFLKKDLYLKIKKKGKGKGKIIVVATQIFKGKNLGTRV
jgi:hypothetical protein